MKVTVEADAIQTKRADDRGRLYCGTDAAHKKITFAILEIEDAEEQNDD